MKLKNKNPTHQFVAEEANLSFELIKRESDVFLNQIKM